MLIISIYIIVAIISGAALGVPIKNLIMKNDWITDSLELSEKNISNGACILIAIAISVIIAICLYFIMKDYVDNDSLKANILVSLLIPVLTFIISYLLVLIIALLYWAIVAILIIIILAIVAFVFLFDD